MNKQLPRLAQLLTAAVLTVTECAIAQQLPVCAANGVATANGSGIVYLQYDVPPPINVQASDGTILGKVDIAWNSVDPAAVYWVYRDGLLISPPEGIKATTFTDTSPEGYKSYAYTVTAGLDGGVSAASVSNSGYALGDGTKIGLSATDGTVTDKVNLNWSTVVGAAGYKIYKNDNLLITLTGDSTTTYSDTSVAGQATTFTYAVSAFKDATETSKASDSGYANVTPTSVSGNFETLINEVSAPYTPVVVDANNPLDAFTFSVITNGAHGVVTIVDNKLVYTPHTDYQGEDVFTIRAVDRGRSGVTGQVNVLVGCPVPLIYGFDVSDDLSKIIGTAQVSPCGDPVNTKVQMKILTGGTEVKNYSLSLEKVAGNNKYYTFAGDISSLNDGTYTVSVSLTDAYSHTAAADGQVVVDWNANATPKFSYKGVPIFTGSTNTESFGHIGVK